MPCVAASNATCSPDPATPATTQAKQATPATPATPAKQAALAATPAKQAALAATVAGSALGRLKSLLDNPFVGTDDFGQPVASPWPTRTR